MIDQDLINRVDLAINTTGVYLSKGDISELLANYIALIEQNAGLHKGLAKSKALLNESADILLETNNSKAVCMAGKIDKELVGL